MALKTWLLRNKDTFTASTDLIDATVGRYIDYLAIHYKGNMSAAASVSVASVLDLLNPLEVRLMGSPIVSVRGSDLYALDVLFFGVTPLTMVAGAVIGNQTKIMGLRAPLWQPPRERGQLQYRFNRVAVSGVDTETISVNEVGADEVLQPAYLHYVELPGTTPATTGFGSKYELAMPGDLIGILLFSTTIPTVTTETATIDEIKLFEGGTELIHRNWQELAAPEAVPGWLGLQASPGDTSILDNYRLLDLRKVPIPKGTRTEYQINAGVASEAYRLVPIYKIAV